VFATLSVYRLIDDNTRLLARKLYKRGILDLGEVQGDQRLTKGDSLRIEYTAFARTKVVVASGQIYGALPRILNVINAHMPPGEQLAMPGLVGDPDPVQLTRVPAPVDRCDAVDWLLIQLADSRPGVVTVVFHSVVMPYLTEESRDQLRDETKVETSYFRVRGYPFNDELAAFVDAHERVYVIEQNRDAQMLQLMKLELTPEQQGRLRSVLHYNGLPIDARSITDDVLAQEGFEVAKKTPVRVSAGSAGGE